MAIVSKNRRAVVLDQRPGVAEQACRFLKAAAPQLTVSSIIDVEDSGPIEHLFQESGNETQPDLVFLASHVQDFYTAKHSIDLINKFHNLASTPVVVLHSGRGKPPSHGADIFLSLGQLTGSGPTQWINELCSFLEKQKTKDTEGLIVPVRKSISIVNEKIWRRFIDQPDLLRSVNPREFEKIIAELLEEEGYEIELTPPRKDGGKDIYAYKHDAISNTCYVVECKRYTPPNKVGVEIIRQLYGVTRQEEVSGGVVVTTSYFTRGATDFAGTIPYQLFLKNFDDIRQWLVQTKSQSNR